MTTEEKLRVLLAEARDALEPLAEGVPLLMDRIDAALAEPVVLCERCETLRGLADTAAAEQGLAQRRMMEAQKQRDEARAHLAAVEKLLPREEYLSDKTLAENLAEWIAALRRDAKERSEFAAAETEHANRWAERAHAAEKRRREIGDEAALAQHERDEARAEVERLRKAVHTRACQLQSAYNVGCVCGADEHQRDLQKLAYQRGAEAMREAAASCISSGGPLLQTYRSILESRIRDLPVPEDKP